MKKMNMKLASLLLSAILTAACAPQICFAADTPAFTAADIVKQLDEPDIQQYDYDASRIAQLLANPQKYEWILDDPNDPYSNGTKVTYYNEGIAILCDDIDALTGKPLGGHRVVVSEGEWASYYYYSSRYQTGDFLVQKVSDFAPEFGQMLRYEHPETQAEKQPVELSKDFDNYKKPVYMISCAKGAEQELASALTAASNIEILGLVVGETHEEIVAGGTQAMMQNYPSAVKLVPFTTNHGSGDVDGNGSVDLGDALTALQAYSDAELMKLPNPLTASQFIAADMDGDSKVTLSDALTILQNYTDETLLHQ